MNIFPSVKKNSTINVVESIDSDMNVITHEMGKIANKIFINKEILSEKWWEFLSTKYNITDESNVITKIDITVDDKERPQYIYKYYVKVDDSLFFIFYDEQKNLDDDEYYEYATEDDKADKVSSLHIFYDPDKHSTEKIETDIIEPVFEITYKPLRKNQFFSLGLGANGFELSSSYLTVLDMDLELNYGTGFSTIHEQVVDKLLNEKYGLFLLYGVKGCGKTTYIRRLISDVGEDCTIIYIPSYMQEILGTSDFMTFISKFKESILIIEDAELIFNKHSEDKKALTNILSLVDSILSENLCIKVIMNSNTADKGHMCPELFRTSKLMINHKFDKLSVENANKLCEKLGYEKRYTQPVVIGEIYEGCNQIKYIEERKVGFK